MLVANDLISSGAPAQTSSVSVVVWSSKIVRGSFQVSVSSGTLNGAFVVQASNDQAIGATPQYFQPTNWNTINSATVVCSTSAPGTGSFIISNIEMSYEYLRLQYTVGNAGAALGTYSVRMKTMGL